MARCKHLYPLSCCGAGGWEVVLLWRWRRGICYTLAWLGARSSTGQSKNLLSSRLWVRVPPGARSERGGPLHGWVPCSRRGRAAHGGHGVRVNTADCGSANQGSNPCGHPHGEGAGQGRCPGPLACPPARGYGPSVASSGADDCDDAGSPDVDVAPGAPSVSAASPSAASSSSPSRSLSFGSSTSAPSSLPPSSPAGASSPFV